MRTIVIAICLALVMASCGADRLTEAEYAEEVESLTTTLFQRIEDLSQATGVPAGTSTMEDLRTYYNELAAAFRELWEGLEALQPPEDSAEDHVLSIDLAGGKAAAFRFLKAKIQIVDGSRDELQQLFDSPEAAAVATARDEMIAFCQEGQADFDATADREVFGDTPWLPSELQEVIQVVLGC